MVKEGVVEARLEVLQQPGADAGNIAVPPAR
jgi:hypothetical protein